MKGSLVSAFMEILSPAAGRGQMRRRFVESHRLVLEVERVPRIGEQQIERDRDHVACDCTKIRAIVTFAFAAFTGAAWRMVRMKANGVNEKDWRTLARGRFPPKHRTFGKQALALLQEHPRKDGIGRQRKTAAFDPNFLAKTLAEAAGRDQV